MLHNLTGWHALIVLAILLLVFGSTKLPSLAKGVGQSLRILKDEVREETAGSSTRDRIGAENDTTTVPYRHAS
ncbi:Sec-independent protein translocase TatA [Rhodococcus sp. 14-2470-1b]|uniref:twin-arginine translocase TatA/TatE family subunit n=1 Tax=unclassified Rhodococcus (in: high G+C Gram-positive bacteria) TaxID=192944 RepID=UPI000B9C712A|nr:twin-arginine translocase TatA/TatE family subunit [Rhodococcus sp. 14-2470-1b]OZF57630.1 Sec-independent protein translocase TatA [Rhodococcus sp. 14-2470-1b]